MVGLLVGFASFASAATMTMTGVISDSMCGASHAKMMAMHKDAKTDRDCTLACVKGGGKYSLSRMERSTRRIVELALRLPYEFASGVAGKTPLF